MFTTNMLVDSLKNAAVYTFIYEKTYDIKKITLCFLQHVYVIKLIYLLICVTTTCVTVALRVLVVLHEGLFPIEMYTT